MIDNIKIETKILLPLTVIDSMENRIPFEWNGFEYLPNWSIHLKDVNYWFTKITNLKIRLDRFGNFSITNSIHKFYRDENWSQFSFNNFQDAIFNLSDIFEINVNDGFVRKMEYGINISAPPDFDRWLLLRGKTPRSMMYGNNPYGSKFHLTDYDMKQYDKTFENSKHGDGTAPPGLVRIEKAVKHMKHLTKRKNPIPITKVRDIMNTQNQLKLLNDLVDTVERIDLSIDFSNLKANEIATVATVTNLKALNSLMPRSRREYLRRYKAICKKYSGARNQTLSDNIRDHSNAYLSTCNIRGNEYKIMSNV